jgi:acyl dehydratase
MMTRPEPGHGPEPLLCGPITLDDVRRYAEASGDRNPIHLEPAVAARNGFAGPIVHGMFILGQFEKLLRLWRPDRDIKTLKVQFLRPLLAGDRLELQARIVAIGQGEDVILRLAARNGSGEIIAAGESAISFS